MCHIHTSHVCTCSVYTWPRQPCQSVWANAISKPRSVKSKPAMTGGWHPKGLLPSQAPCSTPSPHVCVGYTGVPCSPRSSPDGSPPWGAISGRTIWMHSTNTRGCMTRTHAPVVHCNTLTPCGSLHVKNKLWATHTARSLGQVCVQGEAGVGCVIVKDAAWDKTSALQPCGADLLEAGQQHEPRWSAVTPAHCASPALKQTSQITPATQRGWSCNHSDPHPT